MQIRQSSLMQFGDSLVRFMAEAGAQDEDVKYSLDYMHSTYKKKKVSTLISPDTGGIVLLTHEDPDSPFGLIITACTVLPNNTPQAWCVDMYDLGVKQKQKLAQWLVDVFKVVSYLDSETQFIEKMNVLTKDALEQGLTFVSQGTFCRFEHKEYDI